LKFTCNQTIISQTKGIPVSVIDPTTSHLLIIDFQERLMPAIYEGEVALRNGDILAQTAQKLGISITITEQYPKGLGHTVAPLRGAGATFEKITFDALKDDAIAAHLAGDDTLIVIGSEAHVCVLQTVLGALDRGRRVCVVADAIGSRTPENRAAGIARMARAGAEIVTTEMVVFEWLVTAKHPDFKTLSALSK
jgi:nicotinamidase-related amidase